MQTVMSAIVGGVATAIFWGVWRRLVTKNGKGKRQVTINRRQLQHLSSPMARV